VGNLFRSENRTRKKTNLMVFLRPWWCATTLPATPS
jgi:type II secretory pathway component GspD/PulD (secretin)